MKNYVHPIVTIRASLFSHHSTILILFAERTQGSFDGYEKVNRFELNKEYYDKACKRIKLEMAQPTIF